MSETPIQTKLLRLPDDPTSDYPVRYRSLTPIWHPAVFPNPRQLNGVIMGSSPEDVYRQLQDADYACHNPSNIDAAIQYRRDIDRYNQHNKILQSQLGSECSVCLNFLDCDDVKQQLDYSCYNGCVFHIKCVESLNNCPKCNRPFVPVLPPFK